MACICRRWSKNIKVQACVNAPLLLCLTTFLTPCIHAFIHSYNSHSFTSSLYHRQTSTISRFVVFGIQHEFIQFIYTMLLVKCSNSWIFFIRLPLVYRKTSHCNHQSHHHHHHHQPHHGAYCQVVLNWHSATNCVQTVAISFTYVHNCIRHIIIVIRISWLKLNFSFLPKFSNEKGISAHMIIYTYVNNNYFFMDKLLKGNDYNAKCCIFWLPQIIWWENNCWQLYIRKK